MNYKVLKDFAIKLVNEDFNSNIVRFKANEVTELFGEFSTTQVYCSTTKKMIDVESLIGCKLKAKDVRDLIKLNYIEEYTGKKLKETVKVSETV